MRKMDCEVGQCGGMGQRAQGTHRAGRENRDHDRKRDGFTLVELLVVISVIAILMSLIVGAVSVVRKRAKQRETKMNLLAIEQAAGNYKTDHGDFPDSGGGTDAVLSSASLLDRLLNGKGRMAPYLSQGDVPMGDVDGRTVFQDVWKSPVWYKHPRDYLRKPPKAQGIRLFSAGPDGDFSTGDDNVVNWNTDNYPDASKTP